VTLPADGSTVTLTYVDVDDPNCSAMTTVGPLTPCSTNCILTVNSSNISCDDAGTGTDPADDTYTITIDASVAGGGTMFDVLNGVTVIGTYAYATGASFTLPADGSTVTLTLVDGLDGSCTTTLDVGPLEPCSNDCELTITDATGTCNDMGTTTNPDDDTYNITVNATAINGSSSNQFIVFEVIP